MHIKVRIASKQNNNFLDKYSYEKAIEGRNFLYNTYSHWTNMYAIINGALFVGLYTAHSWKLKMLVLLLGVVSGWCWFMSVCGFYRWLISWINVVTHYEKKLAEVSGNYVYKIFTPMKIPYSFSTQKITKFFTFSVALGWSICLVYKTYKFFLSEKVQLFISNISLKKRISFFVTILIILFIVFGILLSHLLREDLSNTHDDF